MKKIKETVAAWWSVEDNRDTVIGLISAGVIGYTCYRIGKTKGQRDCACAFMGRFMDAMKETEE